MPRSNARNTNRKRVWCWTLNNPTQQEKTHLSRLVNSDLERERLHVRYIVFQQERGENGTIHLQGYIEFTKRLRLNAAKLAISGSNRGHLEPRYGTQAEAIVYCKKADTRDTSEQAFHGEGGIPARTKPDSIKLAVAELQRGRKLSDIKSEFPVVHFKWPGKLDQYYLNTLPNRTDPCDILIFYGKPGTGKSCTARTVEKDYYCCPWPMGGRWWWPGYEGQKALILDEFRCQLKYDKLLSFFDKYEFKAEAKGTSFDLKQRTRTIIITTNIHPKEWYPNLSREKKLPLERRLKEFGQIYWFRTGCKYPNFKWRLENMRYFKMDEKKEDEYVT